MAKPVQTQKFYLSGSGVSSSATSVILTSFKLPDNTTNITMSNFGDVGYGTLEPATSREESISFTGVTQNGDGTATLTGVSRGLRFVSPFDAVAGNAKSHAGATTFVISNTSAFYNRFVDDTNAQTIAGLKTFTSIPVLPAIDPTTDNEASRKAYTDTKVAKAGTETVTGQKTFTSTATPRYDAHPIFTSDLELIDKKYADDLAIAGAPNASTTVKGIVEEATAAEITAGTATGGTGARLFVNPTHVATTGVEKIVRTNSSGLLELSILPVSVNVGDGSDGDVTISSPTTLTRDMYYNNLTVNSTLTTDGYIIYVKGTISGSGTIQWGIANAGSNASTFTGGTGGGQSGGGRLKNNAGGNGRNGTSSGGTGGSNGGGSTSSPGVSGLNGGNGANGETPGITGGAVSIIQKVGNFRHNTTQGVDTTTAGSYVAYGGSGGGGGGAAGAGNGGAGNGGAGGGGGASGGGIIIVASIWAGTFTIRSNGANGGNGGNATTSSTSYGGGGGAGGSGGWSIVAYNTKTWTGSYNFTGGTGGTGGTSLGSGAVGATGPTGTTGVSYEVQLRNLL